MRSPEGLRLKPSVEVRIAFNFSAGHGLTLRPVMFGFPLFLGALSLVFMSLLIISPRSESTHLTIPEILTAGVVVEVVMGRVLLGVGGDPTMKCGLITHGDSGRPSAGPFRSYGERA
jgi:hypothetical protein